MAKPPPTMDELHELAERWLKAGHEYREAVNRDPDHRAAMTWVRDSEDGLVLYTRGEYAEAILKAVRDNIRPIREFGAATPKE